jgi:hypothetical protein
MEQSKHIRFGSLFWRWILIVAEVLVIAYLVFVNIAARNGKLLVGPVFASLIFAAWIFLFLGSPFLVSSQRWLAIIGWSIAAATLLFSVRL